MSVIVYTKDQCPYCVKAKTLLTIKQMSFTEVKLGVDMQRDDFVAMFPEQKTVPLIVIDGVKIGGFDKLTEWFDNGGSQLLQERST